MNMKEIEIVSHLINYESFADAALSLSYSPSVITTYVNNVENELGMKIFIRGNKSNSLKLTTEGVILIKAIQRLNNDYEFLVELTSQLKNTTQNVIRIGSQPRYGNVQEQEIIASFLLKKQSAKIDRVKMNAQDLMNLLHAGRLDAIFVSLHWELKVEEYFKEQIQNSDYKFVYITNDKDVYLGISDKYFPGRTEARFEEFKDFTFAVAFGNSSDIQDQKAASTFDALAKENGFKLKKMFFGGYDNTAFKLATMMPLAVCTANITASYPGIKFMRISDWAGGTKLYFIYNKTNRRTLLKDLVSSVMHYAPKGD